MARNGRIQSLQLQQDPKEGRTNDILNRNRERCKTDQNDRGHFTGVSNVKDSHCIFMASSWHLHCIFLGSSNTTISIPRFISLHNADFLQAADRGSLPPTQTLGQAATCFLQEATWLRGLGCGCGHQVRHWVFLGWGGC